MSASNLPLNQAVHALYAEHHGWLFGWLRKKLGCPQNAADLSHDTFLRILASRDALGAMREPRAFLTTTARHLIIDRARRRQLEDAYLRELALTIEMMEQCQQSPEEILVTLEALEQIAFVLDGLALNARQAFLLYFLEGLRQSEIASRLGISERMVRKHLMNALMHCNHALDI
ncbi:sigma-70 family RNA polymerase sigma factor [Pseudomonas sp. 13B_2.1_Bac1]|jgi:RNA polymerase sigma factor (sigma-70 family)|uniref:sigma-70 family RNA polymerase sigma factor n=1 Tax=unclassified Pseudomonas TaxID=196821 RepID=UPI000EA387C9|nr:MULTISPECIES: sigma-70 family RNA polymerase sigma factor [unclassified Pseudomonas]AYF49999.1 RNA polymerase subunit sigma [Pseudomonas fluorescens]MBK5478418.1 sigma-70 family RNA polymerase sigma factor [Pseudomonas sp. TH21]MBS7844984.1 sigma-70 family RNA polymerase sigma factor [Pseudomonas fluorescens]MCU1783809.1 sigma-70 family RNA polymerase sigma factor [Pseudomonas sp. 13B_2.1_Bac1]QTV15948.1 sigma-70 family RNA polymerase sigma factor [Pseudomonas fluorescens]